MTFDFEQFVKGKSVCFVGPAGSTTGEGLGGLIDHYDVVVRFGRGVNHGCPEDLGTRTDVIVENFWEWRKENGFDIRAIADEYVNSGAKVVRMIYPEHDGFRIFLTVNAGRLPVSWMHEDDYLKFNGQVGSPTKGLVAMLDLLRFDIAKLHLVGFTFLQKIGYREPGSALYPKGNIPPMEETTDELHGGHRPGREIHFFKNIWMNDPRVSCDVALEKILRDLK